MNVKKLVQLSMFTVIALTIYSIEAALPALTPIPGIKLGLANIVTLVLLQYYKMGEVYLVLVARILLSSLLGGQMMSFLYSFCGGTCCFLAMSLCNNMLRGKYLFFTSVIGALFHNAGQITIAWILVGSYGVFAYVPFLVMSGVVTGLFTGLCAYFFHKKLDNIKI